MSFFDEDEEVIDAMGHIIDTTFDCQTCESITPSLHSTVPHQERLIEKSRSNMMRNNIQTIFDIKNFVASSEKNGVYCCPHINYMTGRRCMCTFSIVGGRSRHESKNAHIYPTSNLASWVHELHLDGQFAFSLATGSRTNCSEYINQE